MAGYGSVVAKDRILGDYLRIPGAHGLEEDSQMIQPPAGFGIPVDQGLGFRLRQFGIVIEMPLLFVSFAHCSGVALLVPAGVLILAVLWSYGYRVSTDFQQAARSIVLRAFVSFASQHELDDHLDPRIIVNDVVNIGVLTA